MCPQSMGRQSSRRRRVGSTKIQAIAKHTLIFRAAIAFSLSFLKINVWSNDSGAKKFSVVGVVVFPDGDRPISSKA